MISKKCLAHLRQLVNRGTMTSPALHNIVCRASKHNVKGASTDIASSQSCHHQQHGLRGMATVADLPASHHQSQQNQGPKWTAKSHLAHESHVTTTVYKFPEMEPLRFAYYPRSHLYLPMRRDILHRAVVYEGNKTRQGTAFARNRWEVAGSHRKIRPQKGTGKARLGDKQSPMLTGGGASHGPRPRDFSTGLPKQVYDLAFRTALSYRYRKGQLVVVDALNDVESCESWYLNQIFRANGWDKTNGRSSLIALSARPTNDGLFRGMRNMGDHGRIQGVADVDVKDLLEMGRLVIEKNALDKILSEHSTFLWRNVKMVSSELSPVNPALEV